MSRHRRPGSMGAALSLTYGVACYVIFLGTFLYAIGFVSGFGVPKTIDSGTPGALVPSLLIDALLLTLFAVQHSGMARPAFKRWWTRIVPKPVERSTYVLLASLVLALLFGQWRPLPHVVWEVGDPSARQALWGLHALGWLTVLVSTFMISHAHLFGIRQVADRFRGRELPAPTFQTPGLYRHLRHPIMLGFFIAFWSTPRMTAGHLLFAVATTGYILIALQLEERDLIAAFGARYLSYRERVPMFLPRFRQDSRTTTLSEQGLGRKA